MVIVCSTLGYSDLRLWLGDEYRATPLLLMAAQPTHKSFAIAIHRTNAKHKRHHYHSNYSKTMPRHSLSPPTRTSEACTPLATLFYREFCTGFFVVYSAIIFCSFLAKWCIPPLLASLICVVFITQFFDDMRPTRVSVRCGIFYAKILPKIVDTSGFLPYHKGSF